MSNKPFLDGGWSNWTDVSECSGCAVDGTGGTQSTTRTCSNPEPVNGGHECTPSGQTGTTISINTGIQIETQILQCNCPVGK